MRDIGRAHFHTNTLNVGGLAEAVACPLNIVAVCFAPPGGADGSIKVATLAAAVFYLNSGLANMFLDPPNHTETSVMPPITHAVRPYTPPISRLVVAAIVAVSVSYDRWEPATVPVAFLTAALTLQLGSTLQPPLGARHQMLLKRPRVQLLIMVLCVF